MDTEKELTPKESGDQKKILKEILQNSREERPFPKYLPSTEG